MMEILYNLDDSSSNNDGYQVKRRWRGYFVIIDFYEPKNGSDNPPANSNNPDEDEGFFYPWRLFS
jgi:hypothetical protein